MAMAFVSLVITQNSLRSGLAGALFGIDRSLIRVVDTTANRLADSWKANTPSTRVEDSIQVRQTSPTSFVVLSDHFLAPILEFGTRPHVIEPKTKKALHWGQDVFSARANHPGTTGGRGLTRAVIERQYQFRQDVRDVLAPGGQ